MTSSPFKNNEGSVTVRSEWEIHFHNCRRHYGNCLQEEQLITNTQKFGREDEAKCSKSDAVANHEFYR